LVPTKQDDFALRGEIRNELGGFFEKTECLLKIDDVDAVPFPIDVLLHLGIPTFGLVAEVNAGLQ